MRALAVVNPNATTTSGRTRDVLFTALRHDLALEVAETTHRGHATELGRKARDNEVNLVIAVGGDGTVNELINGVLHDGPGPGVPHLGIVPGGSANVLARNLGIPGDPVEATGLLLNAVREHRRHPFNLGRLDDRYFAFAAGMGLDADVVRTVEHARENGRRATPTLYARTAVARYLRQLRHTRPDITVVPGSGTPVTGLAVAIITNCSPWTYLADLPLRPTPHAEFSHGLDLFGLTRLAPASALWAVAQMTTRHGPRGRQVVSLHDQSDLVLRTQTPLPVQVDGDYLGEREQVTVTSFREALHLVY
ncbi:diacylglycerol kinase family lipid kinase [Actinobacteria bacterium YIM 96077]|uniref:Diacylglycerol kinase family lipid kinase n=1 Tax=Phytoactinopolyspora halophila TaxID=1981511 RepID=A0A329R3Y4_9ACTN|nr:diacylglycerol kinase family protein [Phytoactinopolyspora halophila]AYY11996.1 diacylglycerol kinase family lipid kinase [Actinobacteria bacterium YIM 96077]RAW18769.1 diacylglycerol kinase family lipid kinase [Phytoactinopolyspora halophila]